VWRFAGALASVTAFAQAAPPNTNIAVQTQNGEAVALAPIGVPPIQSVDRCPAKDAHDIVVCGQRQELRLDPNVMDAGRQERRNARSATSATPTAQAVCSDQPITCGVSPASLDLANISIVAATAAVRAAKGQDWTRALKTGGPDEYTLYQEAKRRRAAEDDERAAAQVRMKARSARAADQGAHGGEAPSQ